MAGKDLRSGYYPSHFKTVSISAIYKALDANSRDCLWEQAIYCPCRDSSGDADPNCPICRGQGIIFKEPYTLAFGFSSDNQGAYTGNYGLASLGTTYATPQMTENAIENGIGVRDRITVPDVSRSQQYIFNLTTDRYNKGIFIPYKVTSFDDVYTLSEGKLVYLKDTDYKYDSNSSILTILNSNYIGLSISMRLSVATRFYVANIIRETRYALTSSMEEKRAATAYGNINLDKYIANYGTDYSGLKGSGSILWHMPKQLVLRREDLFFTDYNFTDGSDSNPNQVQDSKITVDNSFFAGDTNG